MSEGAKALWEMLFSDIHDAVAPVTKCLKKLKYPECNAFETNVAFENLIKVMDFVKATKLLSYI